jgi:hypothetical protein
VANDNEKSNNYQHSSDNVAVVKKIQYVWDLIEDTIDYKTTASDLFPGDVSARNSFRTRLWKKCVSSPSDYPTCKSNLHNRRTNK